MNDNAQGVIQIPIEDLVPNRFQPRISFDEKALNDLANSIKQHGIIQPLVVRRLGDKYEIIAGERRYKASQIAGLISVPAIITDIDDQSSAEVALVENVQRKDLSAIEEARSYKNILEQGNMTQEELAKRMGISQSSIANKLRLLNLADQVQEALLNGKISERHARSLLAVEDKAKQVELLNRIIDERLTVRQLDDVIRTFNNPTSNNEMDDVPLVENDTNLDQIRNATDINAPTEGKAKFFTVAKPETMAPSQAPTTNDNDSIFFNFQNGEDTIEQMMHQGTSVEEVPMDSIIEEVLDDGTNTTSNPLPTVDLNSTQSLETEFLDVDNQPPIFDNIESLDTNNVIFSYPNDQIDKAKEKVDVIKKLINDINIDNTISIQETELNDNYQIVINIKKDSN